MQSRHRLWAQTWHQQQQILGKSEHQHWPPLVSARVETAACFCSQVWGAKVGLLVWVKLSPKATMLSYARAVEKTEAAAAIASSTRGLGNSPMLPEKEELPDDTAIVTTPTTRRSSTMSCRAGSPLAAYLSASQCRQLGMLHRPAGITHRQIRTDTAHRCSHYLGRPGAVMGTRIV